MKWAFLPAVVGAVLFASGTDTPLCAETPRSTAVSQSGTQAVLDQASRNGKFVFIIFHKEKSAAAERVIQLVKEGIQKRETKAVATTANASDPTERALVERFGVARAPLPMTVAVAPNGAVTGVFGKDIQEKDLDVAIVPPKMMQCMKHLQDQKLVFVCLSQSKQAIVPAGVKDLQNDPDFKDRLALVAMSANDSAESRFLAQMKVTSARITEPYAVLIAPPGVLVGHFDGASTKYDIAAAIHKAGKCCDDENCKHNQGTAPQAKRPTTGRRN